MSAATDKLWKQRLAGKIAPDAAALIDSFEANVELRRQGKLDEKVFAELRLRKGAYGQRYDNGHRHDGIRTRELKYPNGPLTKGPETYFDAPGMIRIKIPFGGCTAEQLDVMADLAEEYADSILHVTTRQDIQLHFINIEDTISLMRRLAAVGVTTQEACGNSVRNVTACPLAGVCHDEPFDVTPYSLALAKFMLNHPDVQDFGRKFKPAFSGCSQHACGLAMLHDMGAVAKMRDGKRGFEFWVGGGLGAVPHQAKLLMEFCPVEELLPVSQAVARVFARLGEKKNRNRARIKFLVAKLGIDEFRRLVEEERKIMPHDPRWTQMIADIPAEFETPLKNAVQLNDARRPEGFDAWVDRNVYPQRQAGYALVTICLPLGDITSCQARRLSDLARKYVGDAIRFTVEQNIVLRWVSHADLIPLYQELKALGLAEPVAGTIVDVTSCPGTDTCKLGIASSRGLAGELRTRLTVNQMQLDQAIRNLRIKVSGCFNSCGQHHIADIGFYGNSRKIGNHTVPHFQVVLGGRQTDNAGTYGMAMGSVPSKAIPAALDAIVGKFVKERSGTESFQAFIDRVGRKEMKGVIEGFQAVPAHNEDSTFYSDWGDPREFTIGDMGMGECAGEIVSLFQFEITQAEAAHFEAQIALEEGKLPLADEQAYRSMVMAAKSLVKTQFLDVPADPQSIVREFTKRFVDTELFFDKYAKGKFAHYLIGRHESGPQKLDKDNLRRLIEEASLFIEACHACDMRLSKAAGVAAAGA